MKKFKLFDNEYYKLINERKKDNIKISSNNEARVNNSMFEQSKKKKQKISQVFIINLIQ